MLNLEKEMDTDKAVDFEMGVDFDKVADLEKKADIDKAVCCIVAVIFHQASCYFDLAKLDFLCAQLNY